LINNKVRNKERERPKGYSDGRANQRNTPP